MDIISINLSELVTTFILFGMFLAMTIFLIGFVVSSIFKVFKVYHYND